MEIKKPRFKLYTMAILIMKQFMKKFKLPNNTMHESEFRKSIEIPYIPEIQNYIHLGES